MINRFYYVVKPDINGGFIVYVPCINKMTQGRTQEEARSMAKDLLLLEALELSEKGRELPASEQPANKNGTVLAVTITKEEIQNYIKQYK